jgi:pimeloyl-ACP methyl ester carboxylesterase
MQLGLRVVLVERPGVGASTQHRYDCIANAAADAGAVADALGHEQFATVGLSGGGPYALACAAMLRDRVPAVGVLGGVVPTVGDDGWTEGIVALSSRFQPLLQPLRNPLGTVVRLLLYGIVPAGALAVDAFARFMPPGDQEVFADPEIQAMFIDDLAEALRRGMGAIVHDAALFGKHWGFRLADVDAPVLWWHGDADSFVSLPAARHACDRLPSVTLHVTPAAGHLGAFALADDILAEVKLAAGWA